MASQPTKNKSSSPLWPSQLHTITQSAPVYLLNLFSCHSPQRLSTSATLVPLQFPELTTHLIVGFCTCCVLFIWNTFPQVATCSLPLFLQVFCITHKFSRGSYNQKISGAELGGGWNKKEKRKEKGYLNFQAVLRPGSSCFIIEFNP